MLLRAVTLVFATFLSSCASGGQHPDPATPDHPAAQDAKPNDAKPSAEGATAGKTLAEHKSDFMAGCSAKVPNAPDYCACSWEQMTKLFTAEEMSTASADDPRLTQFKALTETNCAPKLPEDLLRAEFVKGCSGDEPKLAGYCDCTFGELRKGVSIADITSAEARKSPRFEAAKRSAVKACSPKMPEEIPRGHFMKACVTADPFKPFCGCVWKTMRAEASAAEIEAALFDVETAHAKLEKACGKLRPK